MRDAVGLSIDLLERKGKHDKKVVAIITDGNDTANSELTLEKLVITCINRSNGAGVPRAALQLWSTRMAQPFAGTPSQMRQ